MSTYTSSLGLEQITPGDQAGLWGNTTNNNLALIDQAVTGVTPVNFAGLSGQTYTLTDFDGAVDESRSAVLNITGIAAGSNTIVIPNKQKMYLVRNSTGQNVVFQTPTPTTTYTVGAGNSILIFCNGNNEVFTGIASPSVGTLGVAGGGTGSTTFTAGFLVSTGGTNSLTTQSSIGIGGTSPDQVTGQLSVGKGGTGATSFASGSLLRGNGSSPVDALVGSSVGQVATWNGSQWTAASPSTGVASFSGGVTGLTPATTTTGAITLGGTLEVTSGGTGSTNQAGARANLGIGSVGVINTNGSTTQFLRGDGTWNTPPASGGTVTSVSGAGSVSGITLTGTVTSAGSLTLGGSLSLSSGQVTSALGYTPVPSNGSGASGTWGISISGSAASASSATTATTATNVSGGSVSATSGTFTSGVTSNDFFPRTGTTITLNTSGSPTYAFNNGQFFPNNDNTVTLGAGGNRWSIVYAVNGTINTSDFNQKTEIASLDEAEKRVAVRLKGLIKKFKFKDAVEKKGTANARIHVGIIAQDVGDAFRAEGLDPDCYGVFCYDEWDAQEEIVENGVVKQLAREAGSLYGVRYDQLYAFIVSAL